MDRDILKQKGFSLLELSIVMGVAALLAGAFMPIAVRAIEIKAGEKAIVETALIQSAARKFYGDHKTWPVDLTQLQKEGYLSPRWLLLNPWSSPYEAGSTVNTFSVSTQVPSNLVQMLVFRLPQSSVDGNTVSSVIGAGSLDSVTPGIIAAWSGTIADIPSGWALCDGSNGTPDLRDKFIVGARQDANGIAQSNITGSFQQTGGTISHDHGATTGIHVLTVNEVPPLAVTLPMFSPNQASPSDPTIQRGQNPSDGSLTLNTSGGGQGHAHSIASDLHVPPFYALAFIMKLP